MRLLFWNTHKNENINNYIVKLVEENEIDILILAEYKSNIERLDELLDESRKKLHRCNTTGSERIKIWSNYCNTEPAFQDKYYSLQIINNECIVCGVHMHSDLNGEHYDERLCLAEQIMEEIQKLKKKINSNKIIIVGDINESPYEKTSLSAKGFHGMPEFKLGDDISRIVYGKKYEKMYNPMWNLYGDFSYPPGTYYRSESKLYTPAWFMIDQIIMSQSMVEFLKKDELRIIVECEDERLYTPQMHPNKQISDHFPIMCGFNIM